MIEYENNLSKIASTKIIEISIGPCYDTPGCTIPTCCGIISGKLTNISLTYVSSIPMTTGTTHGYLIGAGIGPTNNQLQIEMPRKVQVPNAVVAYDYNSCAHTVCPQVIGNTYRFDGIFTVPTTAVTTVVIFH